MDLIAAHGISVKDVNVFAITCSVTSKGIARNVFDNSSLRDEAPSRAMYTLGHPTVGVDSLTKEGEIPSPSPMPLNRSSPFTCEFSTKGVNDFVSIDKSPGSTSARKVFALSSKSGVPPAAPVAAIDSAMVCDNGLVGADTNGIMA